MKAEYPVITLLGSNSGRNLGDAAILAAILEVLSQELPDAEFLVPSTHPTFIRKNYQQKYRVRGVNIMPWTGSLRLLGLPTMACLARSDVALICDGIIFGKKLFNPAFNFLITLFFLLPWAKLCGCRLACYSCGIGPFPTRISRFCARCVINACDLVIMRDEDSRALAQEIGVSKEISVTGDAAFLNLVSAPERATEIARLEGLDLSRDYLGVNVTCYIDSWLSANERVKNKADFLLELARGLNGACDLIQSAGNSRPAILLFSTQPMDEPFCAELAKFCGAQVLSNTRYLSHDIQAIMQHCHLFVGMRFHSLVLASAVGVPVLGLIYAPKVRSYLKLLGTPDYGLELKGLDNKTLSTLIVKAWQGAAPLKETQQQVVAQLKEGAHAAAKLFKSKFFLERAGPLT